MTVYQDSEQARELETAFEAAGKHMDMGKSCLRFERLEDVPLDAIAGLVASTTPEQFIAMYEQSRKK